MVNALERLMMLLICNGNWSGSVVLVRVAAREVTGGVKCLQWIESGHSAHCVCDVGLTEPGHRPQGLCLP
jgi:hypothetical protein